MSVNQGVKIPAAMISAGLGDAYYNQGNAALRAWQTLVQCNVISMTLTAPPGSPASGDTYIIGAAPTGAWTGKTLNIAYWSADPAITTPVWEFYAPAKGWLVANQADGQLYIYSGTAWVKVAPTMTNLIGGLVPTPPNDNTKYLDGSGVFSAPPGSTGVGVFADYTPTVTAYTGAFTSVAATGRWTQVGKQVTFTVVIVITTNGTAAGAVIFTLPTAATSTAARKFVVNGREIQGVGTAFGGVIDPAASTTTALVKQYDNTYGLTDARTVVVSGVYEAA
jgi:hypothetical protein